MRFTTHDGAADYAALRAARGVHDIVLEEGDCAPALREMAPYLAIWAEGDEHKIAFCLAGIGRPLAVAVVEIRSTSTTSSQLLQARARRTPAKRSSIRQEIG